jgi:hypothetical protein
MHSQVERGVASPLFGEEVQEVPLRHHDKEAAPRPEVGHIAQHDFLVPYPRTDLLAELLMRPLQKLFEHTQFLHRFERRRMDRVAAEVAQEAGVLLQNQDPSIIPAGPPPATQHPTCNVSDDEVASIQVSPNPKRS